MVSGDTDPKITAYEDKLRELKTAFLQDATLQTEITVFRMVDIVQTTGRCRRCRIAVKMLTGGRYSGVDRPE